MVEAVVRFVFAEPGKVEIVVVAVVMVVEVERFCRELDLI